MFFYDALNFLFPLKCRICGKKVSSEICDNCIRKFKKFEDYTEIYNSKYYNERNNKKLKIKYLDSLIYFFRYKDYIRKLILDYKFFNKYYLGKVFTKIMLKNENFCRNLKIYDIIIPVPMHKIKLKQRGYNQAELLAEDLAKNLTLEYDKTILKKFKNNKRQSSLSEKERFENIKNVFKVEKTDKIKNKRVILVDDICTTSATLEECSRILKEAGANKVTAVVIAKD